MNREIYLRSELANARRNASAADTMGRYDIELYWEKKAEEIEKMLEEEGEDE